VLTFVRHWGCIFCFRRVALVTKRAAEFAAAGVDLAIVGVGTPEQARAFRLLTGWKHAIVVDAERRAYAAADLRRMGCFSLLRPALLRAALAARREGFRQTKTQGDAWQLGGTMVVEPGDRVRYSHRNAGPEDEAPLDDVVAAARAAVARAGP
jgi:peroxiredoxin